MDFLEIRSINSVTKRYNFYFYSNKKGRTLVVIKADNGNTFGGFAAICWQSRCGSMKGARNSFLFSLTNNSKHPCTDYKNELFGSYNNDGPIFGKMTDLFIKNDSNINFCTSNIGKSYALPNGVLKDSKEA
jgi:hypothetical protein